MAYLHGIAPRAFGPNVVAAGLGLALVAGLLRLSWESVVRQAPLIAAAIGGLLATTLLFPGLEGVHRWIALGPLRLNASSVVMPWFLMAVGGLLIRARPALACGWVAAIQALHVLQPDSGQATALGVSAALLLWTTPSTGTRWRVVASTLALLGAAAAWMRPDPLGAIPHVERILHLAANVGAPWLVASLLSVGALLTPAIHHAVRLFSRHSEAAPLAASLAVYFGLTFIVTELGNFPVPVLGAGASPVLGWYYLFGLLHLSARAPLSQSEEGR
ncbi:FtsW/RodA/SpoVE family cell cycle protein [Hyalangium rubrum]|uniref:FtsW/RodA/SpoVE family cell cycle protein n=1 Tax=Hyalangium rubrum TaxID=3103134 RepID=A0ABU5HDX5_9BACT|nr:FtsW/RodA/SpoVE family cell cycle protein [Hyalangium sp. s54d21]MDY7231680.1 FtsW/RodA/SpoVE family cell cycle protein [Hyalangium sp. s54d21]